MVLIASALTITVASRDRYYNNALTGQASLTAASVAKTIASAAEIGDLKTADLDQLVALTQTNPLIVTKTSTLDGPASVSPGLEGVNGASDDDKTSLTNLKVEYSNPPTNTNFKITVNTFLDAGNKTGKSQQTVTIYLTANNPVYPTGFGATLNIFGATQIPNVYMCVDAPDDAKSNFVTFTGALTQNNGTTRFGGDVIVNNKISINANRMSIDGNLVLLGSTASLNGDWGYMVPELSATSYFLDLCNSASPGSTFRNNAGTNALIQSPPDLNQGGYRFTPAGILLQNASMNFVDNNHPVSMIMPSNNKVNTIGSSGKVLMDGNPITDAKSQPYFSVTTASNATLNSLSAYYTSDSSVVQNSLKFVPPASRYDLLKLLDLEKIYAPDGVNPLTGQDLLDKLKAQQAVLIDIDNNGKITSADDPMPYKGPAYYINVSSQSDKLGDPIAFDLTNNNIDVFLIGSGTFNLNNQKAGIRFIRPNGSTHIGRIIFMVNNLDMFLKSSSGTYDKFAGITGAGMDENRYTKPAAAVADGAEPYVYIYGYDNDITADSSSFVEGYYGLYGSGTFYLPAQNQNRVPIIYARFDVNQFASFSGSIGMPIPYCPAPGEGTNSTGANMNPFVISGYITS